MKSKGTYKNWVKKILGLTYTHTQEMEVKKTREQSLGEHVGHVKGSVRLARLPFFVFHILVYALIFLLLQIISTSVFKATGSIFGLSQFSFVLLILVLSCLMFPVHLRRAHDIGWSIKHVLLWSIVPAVLRFLCLLVPLIIVFNQSWTQALLSIMPTIGMLYWLLMQVQLAFLVLLFFAPGTNSENRHGKYVARAFTLDNLYGIKLI